MLQWHIKLLVFYNVVKANGSLYNQEDISSAVVVLMDFIKSKSTDDIEIAFHRFVGLSLKGLQEKKDRDTLKL